MLRQSHETRKGNSSGLSPRAHRLIQSQHQTPSERRTPTDHRLGTYTVPRRRASEYQLASFRILERIWPLCGDPCGKYLAATISEDIKCRERFDEFGKLSVLLTDEVKAELQCMSAATMNRHPKQFLDAR
ncbi:hypothetical protein [Glutamicibacter ardleyensis]|uniref:hypothetical protein n=1 Tax=Glutamicibacter ardleyensis TaxID=225894 RepID=UPI003FCF1DCD